MRTPSIEKALGIEGYYSQTTGIGGIIRQSLEDFCVEEVLADGSNAKLVPELPLKIEGKGRYLLCLLLKHGCDTLLAKRRIARQLGISERRVRIAGIKDKKALTAQHISIENIRVEKLKRIRIDGIQVYPLRFSHNMVFPHMLVGNDFRITIRNISLSISTIKRRVVKTLGAIKKLRGCPNFFGHQRFGTIRPITHLVGKAIAQNNFEKAVYVFLAKPSPHEHPRARGAREKLMNNRDIQNALKYFPRMLIYERLMLAYLAKHQFDYRGALRRLPKRLCRLFLQAYQSYLFNHCLSQRMKQQIPIDIPQIGDYVVNMDKYGLPTQRYQMTTQENLERISKKVTTGDLHIAHPLIGFRQSPSKGAQGETERAILVKEGISQDNFKISSMPEVSAPGELRTIISPIECLKLDEVAPDNHTTSMRKLTVQFMLHRGCYATVLLREFMKPKDLIKAGF